MSFWNTLFGIKTNNNKAPAKTTVKAPAKKPSLIPTLTSGKANTTYKPPASIAKPQQSLIPTLTGRPQPTYQAPAAIARPSYSAPQQSWTPSPGYGQSSGVGTGGNYSNGGEGYSTPAAPTPPRETYSIDDPNKRIADVDSTFRGQEILYNENLKKFIADVDRRKGILKKDTTLAKDGVARNRTIGLTGIGEDFAARGLGHSGLFADASQKGTQAYDRQNSALVKAETDGTNDLNFTASKERSDNDARIQAAKRDALYRLQLKNNLVTGL